MGRAPRWKRKSDGSMSLIAADAAKTVLALFNTTGVFKSPANSHLHIQTTDDDKNVRIQSRSYASTSGEFSAIQIKPNITTTGTVTLYGIECSPRFANAVGGNTLVGIRSTPILKGTSGTLTGDVRVFQAELTDENAAGRTIDGVVSMMWCWHQLAGHTFTGGIYVMDLRTAGGGSNWTGFVNVQASGAGGFTVSSDGMFKNPDADQEAGFVTITIAGTDYEMAFWASS